MSRALKIGELAKRSGATTYNHDVETIAFVSAHN